MRENSDKQVVWASFPEEGRKKKEEMSEEVVSKNGKINRYQLAKENNRDFGELSPSRTNHQNQGISVACRVKL